MVEKQNRNNRKEKQGIVVIDKMDKTVVVSKVKIVKHRYYEKSIVKKKKYIVHDEKMSLKMGIKLV